MMGVDATPRTEVVLSGHGVEPVDSEQLLTLDDAQASQRNGAHNRALSAAH